jgi:MYXO-CTERM domain-containing protein
MRRKCLSCIGSALLSFCPHLSLAATTYYVATTGSDSAAGTEEAPFASVNKANSVVGAGDTVYIHGGTYKITSGTNTCTSETDTVNAITLSKSGTANGLIKYWASPGETPIFDYEDLMANCRVKGFLVSGSYIHMKGIEITQVKQRNQSNHESWGVWISGSNDVFELLNIHHIDGTGLFISKGGNNLVINSDSHHNFDPLTSNGACESGDGFGAHVSAGGIGNVFRACRAWFNSDDDFDLINAFESVTIENCWAWHAGYRYDTGAACGNGNGIKAGGYGTDTSTFPANPPVHVIRGNLSVGNRAAAFYANHHPGNIIFDNNTGYGSNPDFNMLGMSTSGADITVGTYRNNLAVGSKLTSNATGADDDSNSWTLSVTANDSDFSSVLETGLDSPRQADGSLPDIPNFHLASGSDLIDKGEDVGLTYLGAKPDLGCFESGLASTAGGASATGGTTSGGGAMNAGGTPTTGGTGTAGAATPGTAAGAKANGGATSSTKTEGGTAALGGATATTRGKANGGTPVAGGAGPVSGSSSGGKETATGAASGGKNSHGGSTLGGGATTSASGVLGGAATSTSMGAQGGSTANTGKMGLAAGSGNGSKVTASGAPGASGSLDSTEGSSSSGCSCRIDATNDASRGLLSGLVVLGLATLRRKKTRQR